jgi:flagellar motor switch protein FliN/FliY
MVPCVASNRRIPQLAHPSADLRFVTAAITGTATATEAARAAASLLPTATPLAVGAPSRQADAAPGTGQAIFARFTGAAEGTIAVVLAQDLIEALADTPMAGLELTQAVRPALEGAAAALGPVVVDPGEVLPTPDAVAAIVAAGGVLVPLTNAAGVAAAVVALTVTAAAPASPVHGPAAATGSGPAHLGLLHEVELEVTAELGRTRMTVRELLALTPGAVVELDGAAGGPVDLLVNGRTIARGEVVVIDESFGIRITEIVTGR